MAVSVDLAKVLDKAWEDKSLEEVLDAPVTALAGVSDGDATRLQEAFTIRTVRDLGSNKHFAAAGVLSPSPGTRADAREPTGAHSRAGSATADPVGHLGDR
jgi:hypothetical protein